MTRYRIFWLVLGLIGVMIAVGTAVPTTAEGGFTINWWSVDGGTGHSMGGDFTLKGIMGQPDTGTMSGGEYQINGGFWDAPGAPGHDDIVFLPLVRKP
jgi:hypothetical protein